ncbi:hypothetical protein NEOKW01_0062 [Nematocida sp. AWRm80]|nr:hypothetical protein NEOKW01_0062 [Nematocida sp. AWRm80]
MGYNRKEINILNKEKVINIYVIIKNCKMKILHWSILLYISQVWAARGNSLIAIGNPLMTTVNTEREYIKSPIKEITTQKDVLIITEQADLDKVPEGDKPNYKTLLIYNCILDEIPDQIREYTGLQTISILGTTVNKRISGNIFMLPAIESICMKDIKGKPEMVIPIDGHLLNQTTLTQLKIEDAQFKNQLAGFNQLKYLTELVLLNISTEIDMASLNDLSSNLVRLTLSNLSLKQAPAHLNSLIALISLDLSNNQISTIDWNEIKPMKSLKRLDLSNNDLITWDIEVLNNPSLTKLILSYNLIEYATRTISTNLTPNKDIQIEYIGNPTNFKNFIDHPNQLCPLQLVLLCSDQLILADTSNEELTDSNSLGSDSSASDDSSSLSSYKITDIFSIGSYFSQTPEQQEASRIHNELISIFNKLSKSSANKYIKEYTAYEYNNNKYKWNTEKIKNINITPIIDNTVSNQATAIFKAHLLNMIFYEKIHQLKNILGNHKYDDDENENNNKLMAIWKRKNQLKYLINVEKKGYAKEYNDKDNMPPYILPSIYNMDKKSAKSYLAFYLIFTINTFLEVLKNELLINRDFSEAFDGLIHAANKYNGKNILSEDNTVLKIVKTVLDSDKIVINSADSLIAGRLPDHTVEKILLNLLIHYQCIISY